MRGTARRLVLLDRDGVVNRESPGYVTSVGEWQPLAGSLDAIARLARRGYSVVVVTNQSAVGRHLMSARTLEAIHAHMRAAIEQAGGSLAGIYCCLHAPQDGCDCRKPKPGLLRQVEKDFGVTLSGVPMVGDKLADVEAAVAVGARPVLVLSGYGVQTRDMLRQRPDLAARVQVHADLASAVDSLLDERAHG